MDGGQLTAVLIVAIIVIGSIIRAGARNSRRFGQSCGNEDGRTQVENQRLRDEVLELKERIKVLERITVEKENSLAKEIDALRDR